MEVEVVLVLAAKRDQVVAFHQCQVITIELILSVPEAGADVLCVYVERCKRAARFTEWLQSSSQSRDLRWGILVGPRPVVAQIAVVEVVGEARGDIRRETCDVIPGLLRTAGDGSCLAQFVAGEESTDVNLACRSLCQLVIAIAGHEVPPVAEVVVEPADEEVILCWEVQVACEFVLVDAIASWPRNVGAASNAGRFVLVPHLLDDRVDSDVARIDGSQIVGRPTNAYNAVAQIGRGHRAPVHFGIRIAVSLIKRKEVGLASH